MITKGTIRLSTLIATTVAIVIVIAVTVVELEESIKHARTIDYTGLALLLGTVLVPLFGLKGWEKKLENNA